MAKQPHEPYRPPDRIDNMAEGLDNRVEDLLGRLLFYLRRRWPRLARFLSGEEAEPPS